MMRFSAIRFEPGGGYFGHHHETWSYADIELVTDDPEAARPAIRVDIPWMSSEGATIEEWREEFRHRAVQALRAAADALEANTWPELLEKTDESNDLLFDVFLGRG